MPTSLETTANNFIAADKEALQQVKTIVETAAASLQGVVNGLAPFSKIPSYRTLQIAQNFLNNLNLSEVVQLLNNYDVPPYVPPGN